MARSIPSRTPGEWDPGDYSNQTYLRQTERLKVLIAQSRLIDLTKTCVGVVVRFRVANSYAYYRVDKDMPLTLEHIPFDDAWRVRPEFIQRVTVQDIIEQELAEREQCQSH